MNAMGAMADRLPQGPLTGAGKCGGNEEASYVLQLTGSTRHRMRMRAQNEVNVPRIARPRCYSKSAWIESIVR